MLEAAGTLLETFSDLEEELQAWHINNNITSSDVFIRRWRFVFCRKDDVTPRNQSLYIWISLNWAARVASPGIPHGRCSHWCHTVIQVTRPFHSLNASFLQILHNWSQRCLYSGAESRLSYLHRNAITSVIAEVMGSLSAHVPLHHGCNITAKPKLKFE